ncbi:hypothetical protein B0H34DRAFT_718788 [Crassisporium funariophilum]|nr:hypothetical protein B0H34DRAFT_718788 [Crassisporium funariophilum]
MWETVNVFIRAIGTGVALLNSYIRLFLLPPCSAAPAINDFFFSHTTFSHPRKPAVDANYCCIASIPSIRCLLSIFIIFSAKPILLSRTS